jgi:hypothetical protein
MKIENKINVSEDLKKKEEKVEINAGGKIFYLSKNSIMNS